MSLPSISLDELISEIDKASSPQENDKDYLSREELQDFTGKTKDQLRTILHKAHKEKRLSVKTVYRERLIPGRMVPMPGYKFLPKPPSQKKPKTVD